MELTALTEATAAAVAKWFDADAEGRRRLGFYADHPKWWDLVASDESRHGFVALFDGEPVGFVDLDHQGEAVNVSVYVRAAHRREGHGVGILEAAIVTARSIAGDARLVAEVEPDNVASIRTCTNAGMRLRAEPNQHGELTFELDLRALPPSRTPG